MATLFTYLDLQANLSQSRRLHPSLPRLGSLVRLGGLAHLGGFVRLGSLARLALALLGQQEEPLWF